MMLFIGTIAFSIFSDHTAWLHDTVTCIFFLVAALLIGSIGYLGFQLIRTANKMTDDNLYVPTVRDQIAYLPAGEVLLRGSDQPAATSSELLRAAHEGTRTDAEELLRADGNLSS